jgi:hypothetical protein
MKGEEEELKDAREDVEAMIENTLTILVFLVCCVVKEVEELRKG